jgi:hypothetical protein
MVTVKSALEKNMIATRSSSSINVTKGGLNKSYGSWECARLTVSNHITEPGSIKGNTIRSSKMMKPSKSPVTFRFNTATKKRKPETWICNR